MNNGRMDQENKDRFKVLVEHSTDWIWETDAQGIYTYSSPQIEQILGYTPQEILGKQVFDLMPPDEAFRIKSIFEVAKKTKGNIHILENINIHKNGSIVVLETNGVPIINQQGKITGYRGIDRDITQRKNAENALKISEDRYRAVVEDSPGLICRFSADCTITYVNPAYCEYFGIASDQLIGTSFMKLIPESDRQTVLQEITSLSVESPLKSHEHRVIDSNNEIRWQRWSNHALFDESGILRAYQAIGEDITEYKNSEVALQRAEHKFRTIYNSSSEALMMLDQKGFFDCNQTTLTLFGVNSVEEFCKLHPSDVSPPVQADGRDSITAADEHINASIRDGYHRFEWLHKRTDNNQVFPAEVIIIRMELDGRQVLNASVRDISHQKEAEARRREIDAQLQQVQRLEGLGVLAGGIAHDFNNILMGIMGNAELALDDLPAESPTREELKEIINASRRAADLCQQMLAYAGKGQVERVYIGIQDLVMDTLTMLKSCISKRCDLNLQLEKDAPLTHGDPSQISQIIMNLLVNASEAIGDRNGEITISSGLVTIDKQTQLDGYMVQPWVLGDFVYLQVSDSGSGIDPMAMQRIFDPFYTTKFTGRGLGLSAVLGIVQAHKGGLSVESQPGQGTTFRVLFPAATEKSSTKSSQKESYELLSPGTALLVDDESSVRIVCTKLLQRLGFCVLSAENGEQAVDLYRQNQRDIEIILLDLTMPVMDGVEAFRELRKLNPDIRVILATGFSEVDVRARYASEGFLGYLHKPYTLTNLRNEIVRVFSITS